MVEADVHQFEQVIMNLAVNARDAMPAAAASRSRPPTSSSTSDFCRAHPGVLARASTSCCGVATRACGMDEQPVRACFEPFFTTKEVGKGTGLGLSTVLRHRQAERGKHLPCRASRVAAPPSPSTSPRAAAEVREDAQPSADTPESRGTETILLVEDEGAVRELVTRVLRDLGYEVTAVGSAHEARDAADATQGRLRLLITDVVLPGDVQGNELARELVSSTPDLPVIYISGYSRTP